MKNCLYFKFCETKSYNDPVSFVSKHGISLSSFFYRYFHSIQQVDTFVVKNCKSLNVFKRSEKVLFVTRSTIILKIEIFRFLHESFKTCYTIFFVI